MATHLPLSDCAKHNIMMDASAMYPDGFHPLYTDLKSNGEGTAYQLSRSSVEVKYHYIDFDVSSYFPPDVTSTLVTGLDGLDYPPELSADVPYDPFKLDVYILGNLFRVEILRVRS
jgi:hypothetical protein